MTSVPLERRFTPVPASYLTDEVSLDQLQPYLGRADRKDWRALLELHRVIILADAGAGKTFELRSQAQAMVDAGKAAFFLRLEDIDETFGSSFEVGSPSGFEAWLRGTHQAWFFLDSVDEIRLSEPRAFEAAIRSFAARLGGQRQRAHVYVSSRPYAWRSGPDQALMNEVLPYTPRLTEETGEEFEADFTAPPSSGPSYPEEAGEPTLRIFFLATLDRPDISLFASHRGIANVDRFVDALERGNLDASKNRWRLAA